MLLAIKFSDSKVCIALSLNVSALLGAYGKLNIRQQNYDFGQYFLYVHQAMYTVLGLCCYGILYRVETVCGSRNVGKYKSTLRIIPEERIPPRSGDLNCLLTLGFL
jgi:hypothetical protein